MTREQCHHDSLERMYRHFARIQTGGLEIAIRAQGNLHYPQCADDYYVLLESLSAGGPIDAPEALPAGSMRYGWQREARRL